MPEKKRKKTAASSGATPKKRPVQSGSKTKTAAAASNKKKNPSSALKQNQTSGSKKKMSGSSKILIGLLTIAIVIGLGSMFFSNNRKELEPGIAYLKAQEEKNTDELEKTLTQKRRDRMLQAVESGQSSVFSLFRNSLLFGDSRMYGFGSYSLVPWEQVMADAGATILNISDYVDKVKEVQPQKMYFSYGVNDMGLQIGSDQGEDGYAKVYESKIDELLKVSPKSQIIINSVIPATPARVASAPNWGQVDEFNRQIEEMCKRRGWTYIDNTSLADGGNAPIYQPDGVHFLSNFYPVWAQNMIFNAS